VMASTAPMMDCSASGGTPPGSMTTSGAAAQALDIRTAGSRSNRAEERRMRSGLPGHHSRPERGFFGKAGHLHRHARSNIVVQLRDLATRFGHDSGAAG